MNKDNLNYYLMYGHLPKEHPLWDIRLTSEIKNEETAKTLIINQLEKLIKSIAEKFKNKKIGILLSGGIDSSIVVAIASKYIKNLNTFSIRFEYNEFDESKYAQMISKQFGTKHHEINFSAKNVRSFITKLKSNPFKPCGDQAVIPLALACEIAKKHVDIILTGDGGDELFGGYVSYQHYKLLNIQKYYPKCINKIFYPLFNSEKIKTFFEIGCLKHRQKFARLMSLLNGKQFKQLTNENPNKYYDIYAKYFKEGFYLDEAINMDLHRYLPECGMEKVNLASSVSNIKIICPFLDPRMVKLACRIDSKLKLRKNEKKYILRKAFEGIIPKEIFFRKKHGFGVPLKHYLKNELKDLVDDYVFNYKHNLFNTNFLKEIIKRKKWGRDYSKILWAIIIFNLWWRRWIKG